MLVYITTLLIENTGNTFNSTVQAVLQILSFLAAFVVVIVLAIIVTKFVATSRHRMGARNRNIKHIESVGVGHQSSVQLIQVGKKIILIGVTKDKITFLQELQEDDVLFTDITASEAALPSFKKVFDKYLQRGEKDNKDENND
jgi:flagellar biogenesis protein FliO